VLSVRGKPPELEEGEYVRDLPPPTIESGRLSAEFARGKRGGTEYRSVLLADLDKGGAGILPEAVVNAVSAIESNAKPIAAIETIVH
jgi:hypothetical protein